ncbi:uncharacterized protein LOC129771030 [Toxorhynchites rutilus septentrionalis]|uniref:uncharacterized protein LOC129771030 n=1 Tax=Toxorhynchites rutilus septentrionalis TaxID=329112 RepID=UPI0024795349|nr:uncharacterized protein LOC129771030 [Toxorhynchites rutilus septentrionalis]
MDANRGILLAVDQLCSRLKLLPLVESCEQAWPTRIDLQLIVPNYQNNLFALREMIRENGSLLLSEVTDNMLRVIISVIQCCYESTAFLLDEGLADVQRSIRDEFVWDKVVVHHSSGMIMLTLFKHYEKVLLSDSWFYHFGDLSSFWGFVWDLLGSDVQHCLLNRSVVALIEQICFKLMRSQSIQLCIKGVTIIEECIYKTRNCSLMDYEVLYDQLFLSTWRMFENDERNQKISVILLNALIECIKVLEVDRNQLFTVIRHFDNFSRADALMELLLKGLAASKTLERSTALIKYVILLLTIEHSHLRVLERRDIVAFNSGDLESKTSIADELIIMDGRDIIGVTDWWKIAEQLDHSRFHLWTSKLLYMLATEIDKLDDVTVYLQYLICVLFFIIDCPGLCFDSSNVFIDTINLMVTFLRKYANTLNCAFMLGEDMNTSMKGCVQFFHAAVQLLKEFSIGVLRNHPNLSDSLTKGCGNGYELDQIRYLDDITLEM